LLPRAIETLVLWDTPDEEDTPELIERGLVNLIQGRQYPHLKAIFLEATERRTEGTDKIEPMYQDAVAAGVVAGVDVHTYSSQKSFQHSIQFTEAPDEFDLKSGIYSGLRPAGWIFDPYLGRRIPPGSTSTEHNALWAKQESRLEVYHGGECDEV
jgi:hypothetical protein